MSERPPAPRYYGKLAKVGLIWGVLRVGTNSLLALPTTVILARLLTPQEFGVAAAAYFFLQLASRLTQFGFGVALVQVACLRREHASSVFLVSLAIGAAAWLAVIAGAPAMGTFLRSPGTSAVLPTAGFGFVILAAGVVPTALLSRDMRFRQNATSDWIGNITNSAVAIVLAWQGFSFWSLVYAQLTSDAVRVLVRIRMARWRPSLRFSREAMGEIFSFGAGVYAKNLLEYAVQNLDNLVVGRLLGITALGFYDKAFSFTSRLVTNINTAGPSVSLRIFSLIHEEPTRFRRAYRKVVLTVTLIGYPVLTGMIVAAPQLIEVLFGPRWLASVVPFQILCVAAMLKLLNTYASSATQAKGMIWAEVRRQACFTILLVAVVSLLCRWGIPGAAAGVLLATAAMTILLQSLVKRLTGLSWRDLLGPQVPAAVCSAGLIAVMLVTRAAVVGWLRDAGPWPLLLASITAAAVYYLAFLLWSPFREVRELVRETIHDLFPAIAPRFDSLVVRPGPTPVFEGPVT